MKSSKNSAGWRVAVTVADEDSKTQHTVSVPTAAYDELTEGRVSVEELVRASFEFLLEHEPKESILASFDIMLIAQYFPNYPRQIRAALSG